MKSLRILLTVIFTSIVGVAISAQSHDHMNMNMTASKTASFRVWGNCEESCKTRIEKTAMDEGVTSAVWTLKTQLLVVSFDPAKTSVDAISKKLASVGHDTEKYKADDKVYNSLDTCCKYPRSK